MIFLTWLLSLVITAAVTYHYRRLVDSIQSIKELLKVKADKPIEKPKESFVMVDLEDPIFLARQEQRARERILEDSKR